MPGILVFPPSVMIGLHIDNIHRKFSDTKLEEIKWDCFLDFEFNMLQFSGQKNTVCANFDCRWSGLHCRIGF